MASWRGTCVLLIPRTRHARCRCMPGTAPAVSSAEVYWESPQKRAQKRAVEMSMRALTTYVLVHGSWHGGWCWQKLLPFLRGEHLRVYTPTLTGLGERRHLVTPTTGL